LQDTKKPERKNEINQNESPPILQQATVKACSLTDCKEFPFSANGYFGGKGTIPVVFIAKWAGIDCFAGRFRKNMTDSSGKDCDAFAKLL
jgi:hypothetical protein